ncbi:MAG: rane protein with repeat [Chitinophagaceae bacterium]|nr:rane protein with repeat [Chitinophagaceae bacterium]
MTRFLIAVTAVFASIVFLSALFFTEPLSKSDEIIINPEYEPLSKLYTTSDSLNVFKHYKNVSAHLEKPYFQNTGNGLLFRNDEAIEGYYTQLSKSNDSSIADIGNLGLSFIYLRNNRVNFAYEHFVKVKNHNLPYYEQEKGLFHLKYRELDSARIHLTHAVKTMPDSKDAQLGLIETYYYDKDYAALKSHLTPATLTFYPEYILSDIYFYDFDLISYYRLRFKEYNGTWLESIAALLVAFLWITYFLKLNVFQSIKPLPLVVTVLLSAFTTFSCLLMYEFYHVYLDFGLTGSVGNDLLYTVLGIGLIEEFAKCIPLVAVVLLFRKNISEPYHYLLIAAASALTFSTLENILYFKEYPGQVIYIRSMISVVVHLFGTCVISYGLFVVNASKKEINIGFGALCFLAAILLHGLFDLVLINVELSLFHLFSYALMFFAVYALNRMINYALNTSPDFNPEKQPEVDWLRKFMIVGFTSILLFEFIIGSVWNGFYVSKDVLIDSMLAFILLLIFLVSSLSKFHFIYGYRTGIFQVVNEFKYQALLHTLIKVKPVQKKQVLEGFDLHTTILHAVDKSANYIHGILMNGEHYQGQEQVFIKPYSSSRIKNEETYYCNVYGLKDPSIVNAMDVNSKDLVLLTKARIILEADSSKKASWGDKLGLWPIVITLVIGSLLFMFYMNYKSARLSYKWSFDFIETKTLYKGYENLEYALDKDGSFSEAHLLMAKINIYLKQYEIAYKQLENVSPHTQYEKQSVSYLKGYCLYKLKREGESMVELLELLQAYPSSKGLDSAYRMIGEMQVHKSEYADALNSFSRIEHKDNHILYLQALSLIEVKKYKESNQILTQLIESEKNPSSDILYNKGLCLLYLQDTSAACQWLNLAAEHEHTKASALKGDWCYHYNTTE